MYQLTKTDFIQYLRCPESVWLMKRRPDVYTPGEFSAFLRKLIAEGYEVEAEAQKLFSKTVEIGTRGDSAKQTRESMEIHTASGTVFMQPTFITKDSATDVEVFARLDFLECLSDGSYHLYEVKSGTQIKTDLRHNHIKDACFQKLAAERSGVEITRVSIVYLNKKYTKNGVIDPAKLLIVEDVSERIVEIEDEVSTEVHDALALIATEHIPAEIKEGDAHCDCRYKTHTNHCDSFAYFNDDIPEESIYTLSRIRKERIAQFLNAGIMRVADIPEDAKLSKAQKRHWEALQEGAPVVDYEKVRTMMDTLTFPLYFFDYETYTAAVPKIDGTRPHQQVPFQYSLHVLHADGALEHFEYLADEFENPLDLVLSMRAHIGEKRVGTFVSWYASFEKTRNKEMALAYPEHAEFLLDINARTFDLMKIFTTPYVDARFGGSASIKKVLPVICPELNYGDLDVQNGTQAMDTWVKMVTDETICDDAHSQTRKQLLEYCALDTLAMVEIYKFIINEVV